MRAGAGCQSVRAPVVGAAVQAKHSTAVPQPLINHDSLGATVLLMEQNNAMKTRAIEAEALVDSNKNSRSWRLTAPLRRLHSALRRLR